VVIGLYVRPAKPTVPQPRAEQRVAGA
jgi:hypothetical protein